MPAIYVGTSGYCYNSWRNDFYPPGMGPSKWLYHYSSKFNTLELNNTFYKFPVLKNLEKMYDITPPEFRVTVKINRVITHSLRLRNAQERIKEFINTVDNGLKEKAGCILFQMPPSFQYSEENKSNVLNTIPAGSRHVIEFRHISWWTSPIAEELRKKDITFCNVSFPNLPETIMNTSDTFYLRMHGVPMLFASPYTDSELIEKVRSFPRGNSVYYIYFNNTMYDAAYKNAATLNNLVKDLV